MCSGSTIIDVGVGGLGGLVVVVVAIEWSK